MNGQNTEPCGVLVINKPQGITSHDVVGRVRKLYGTRRVGHTGTLDPLATGVLVILIGRAAKAAEYLVSDKKEYRATLTLGFTTDTEDITGTMLTSNENIPDQSAVFAACREFVGKIMQTPPMYSALKVGGKKLVDLAREGIEVERVARQIEIFSLECEPTDKNNEYVLCVKCSSGTYIRTLCADIGARLGCGAVMSTLERLQAGEFTLDNAHTLEELEALGIDERLALLLPVESLFETLSKVCLPAFYERLCRSGCEIYQAKIKTAYEVGQRVRICSQNGEFFALGEVGDYENGSAVKAIKLFSI